MRKVFVGSEAVAAGTVTTHELRRRHQRMFRDVYIPKSDEVTLLDRIEGAWLRSGRQAVIASRRVGIAWRPMGRR
jgi:hypothetical protein